MRPENKAIPAKNTLNCSGRLLDLSSPKVMGILNVTPDSFFDGGQYTAIPNILSQCNDMLKAGAAIIDIGGQSTRPGAQVVSAAEECKRIIPAIQAIKDQHPDSILSVDTFKAEVAYKAVEAGATIVNDISAGEDDPEMLAAVGQLQVPYIMMHKQGNIAHMQDNPSYNHVTFDIIDFFSKKLEQLQHYDLNDVVLDPGFGFGKTLEHNYQLLRELDAFKIFELPLLVGVSRKSMIHKLLHIPTSEALNGTTVLHTLALINGAKILRVHDVPEAVETIKLTQAYHGNH